MVTKEWGEFAYAPPSARSEDLIFPPADEVHHLFRVRRIQQGDKVCVTDGEGTVYVCAVLDNHRLRILQPMPEYGEPAQKIILCAAVLKGEGNREVVDTATQLGASEIALFHARRSEGRLQDDKVEKLRRIAVTAIKQCGRARLPRITIVGSLEAALGMLPKGCTKFVAHPFEDLRNPGKEIEAGEADSSAVMIGPEGGFVEEEVDLAVTKGCRPLILARRRLRAETAVAAGLTFLLIRQRGDIQIQESRGD